MLSRPAWKFFQTDTQCQGLGEWPRLWHPLLAVCFFAGQPPGPWPWTAVTVVAVLSAMVMLSAGILWFALSR